ncbi:hypothetical protein M422DRAFT_251863 [Sphaerobolus stellatus SS14]|uniref:Uncharacterized protein n=1 Tax=Sphaerobolus stellatus (strain SS14) TaxID=990650 RepID=A0A0C9VC82_SPHS4|nr:hypothetical protein M422DRAFT_251863 [Sphaerobolus stellatus SS14]
MTYPLESEIFQVPSVPKTAERCGWLGHTHPAGPKVDPDQRVICLAPASDYHSFRVRLPRVGNAMPGCDGHEVEIFEMEGIPAPDGLNQNKRLRIENRVLTEELRVQLAAHKALMGGGTEMPPPSSAPEPPPDAMGALPFPPSSMGFPLPFPPGGLPPGYCSSGFVMPPPGVLRPGPPFHAAPPSGLPPDGPTPPFLPTPVGVPTPAASTTPVRSLPTPNPSQTNPPLKTGTVLVWQDANYSPIERRALDDKYRFNITQTSQSPPMHVSTGDDSPSKGEERRGLGRRISCEMNVYFKHSGGVGLVVSRGVLTQGQFHNLNTLYIASGTTIRT